MDATNFTTPVEIDSEIARLMGELVPFERAVATQLRYQAAANSGDPRESYTACLYDADTLVRAQIALDAEQAKLTQFEEEHYTGWQRYYHVTNNNGHIHTSMACSSCFPDTQFSWRTDLSGLTVEEVVAKEAYNACTVCMPIAPAEQKAARERYNAEQRAAKQAEKDQKANDKLKKAAERAVKFLAKVDAAVEKHCGSWDAFWTEYSLYGHDGRKSVYGLDVPSQVGDYLHDEKEAQEHRERGQEYREGRRHMKDPKKIVAEAREKGLID